MVPPVRFVAPSPGRRAADSKRIAAHRGHVSGQEERRLIEIKRERGTIAGAADIRSDIFALACRETDYWAASGTESCSSARRA